MPFASAIVLPSAKLLDNDLLGVKLVNDLGDYARALLALDRIICLTPDSVPALRERGLLAARLGSVEAARADLSRLLELVPQAPDASSIRKHLAELRAKAVVLN